MRLLTTLFLLAATLLRALSGLGVQTTVTDDTTSSLPAIAAVDTAISEDSQTLSLDLALPEGGQGVDYDEMVYTDYDDGPFYAAVETLYDLADEGQTQELLTLYDQLYEQIEYLDTMASLAYISYCEDVNGTWFDAYQNTINQLTLCCDALSLAGNYITQSDCADAFAEHVGQDVFDDFAEYEALTDREIELYDQETVLVNEYYQILDQVEAAGYTFNYEGRDWDWDMFYGYQGDALAESDYNGYLTVYYGLQQVETEAAAPIYAQLVSIRQEIAAINGYDSYNDYAYELTYGRDYTPDDAQVLCDAVKAIAPTYYEQYYYNDMYFATDEVLPVMDTQTILDTLAQYVVKVDESLAEPLTFMESHGLYSMGDEDERITGAFTTQLSYYQSPFIFSYNYNTVQDFLTISHEFGHYCNFYFHAQDSLLLSSDMDLMEIHSNGLQALLTQWYDEIFTQGADVAEFVNLSDLMENILDGCIQDEFQRRIYDCQEELTAETINRIYVQVCSEYNPYVQDSTWNSSWLYIPHNFESPLYYISYAASAVAALQIWDLAQTDSQAASDIYMAIQNAGAAGQGYCQVLADCGLRLFSEEGAVADICQPVLDRLAQLDAAYYTTH